MGWGSLRWLGDVAELMVTTVWVDQHSLKTPVNLVEKTEADLRDTFTASRFANALAGIVPLDNTIASLDHQLGARLDTIVPLETGLWLGRRGCFFRYGTTLVLAFEATKSSNEMLLNACSHANDKKWCPPYPRYLEDRQVHSLYLDMWLGMRQSALDAITDAIMELEKQGQPPARLIITGHSMGGGIST
jgi:hypothetical protein